MSSKELLMEAALAILARDGFDGVTIRKIADYCNLSVAAPYKHFKNKEDILRQSVGSMVEQWKIREAKIIARYAPDLREQMVRLSMEWIQFVLEKPAYAGLLMADRKFLPSSITLPMNSMMDYTRDCLSRLTLTEHWSHEKYLRTEYVFQALTDGAMRQLRSGQMEDSPSQRKIIQRCLRDCLENDA